MISFPASLLFLYAQKSVRFIPSSSTVLISPAIAFSIAGIVVFKVTSPLFVVVTY